jgi:hypothetical protein
MWAHLATQVVLSFQHFVCVPALNGNNGEATNTDDLDNAGRAAERIRNKREATTNRHRRNPGAGGGKCPGPVEPVAPLPPAEVDLQIEEVKVYYSFAFLNISTALYLVFSACIYLTPYLLTPYRCIVPLLPTREQAPAIVMLDGWEATIIRGLVAVQAFFQKHPNDTTTDQRISQLHLYWGVPDHPNLDGIVYDPLANARMGYIAYRTEQISRLLLHKMEREYPLPSLTDKSISIFKYCVAALPGTDALKQSTALYFFQCAVRNNSLAVAASGGVAKTPALY